MALATREHSGLKLADVSARPDHLRGQVVLLQDILKDAG
jgi:hypothetical protein